MPDDLPAQPEPEPAEGALPERRIPKRIFTVLLRYWAWTPEEDVRPLIFLMSD